MSSTGRVIENSSGAQARSFSRNPKKREAALIDDDDEYEVVTPSSSQDPAPKRQRFQPSAPKPRVTSKAKRNVKSEDDDRPEPRGQPEVWAEVRIMVPRLTMVVLILL